MRASLYNSDLCWVKPARRSILGVWKFTKNVLQNKDVLSNAWDCFISYEIFLLKQRYSRYFVIFPSGFKGGRDPLKIFFDKPLHYLFLFGDEMCIFYGNSFSYLKVQFYLLHSYHSRTKLYRSKLWWNLTTKRDKIEKKNCVKIWHNEFANVFN